MQWSDWALWLLMVAVAVIVWQLLRLVRKNRRLRQLADEANSLRRRAEATEQRNRQLKQEMTSNIAHELKTPLSSIRGYLEILLSDKPIDDDRKKNYLERCYKQTLRLGDLVSDVAMINKLEESSDLFKLEKVRVDEVMDEAADGMREEIEKAGMVVENNLSEIEMQGNRELLFRIFRNLIENAVAYAGSGSKVIVETYRPTTDHCYIHFYDTGIGVDDRYLSRLFDRFVRIDEGRSRRNGGTGLGLSIVKHAVMFHHGEIYAKNRSEGGLEFFFSLKV